MTDLLTAYRTAYADATARLERAVTDLTQAGRICRNETPDGAWCGACCDELRAHVAADVAELEYSDARRQCSGMYRRQCENAARPDSAYCEECAPAFDALCNGTPPAPTEPSPIELITLPNGMIRMTYKGGQFGVCSADALEALRLYLAAGIVEAYDDALETIAELREAA